MLYAWEKEMLKHKRKGIAHNPINNKSNSIAAFGYVKLFLVAFNGKTTI
jgi:hypothetical protein